MSATKPSGKIPPKLDKETVYVDVDDEITTIIDKVETAKEKIVALVLPKRSTTLQSIVNMRLLGRSADNADKNVVLITKEEALLPLAGAAGLHVASSLQDKPEIPPSPRAGMPAPKAEGIPTNEGDIDEDNAKLDYHRSIGELAGDYEEEEPEAIALGDEDKPAEKPEKSAKTPKSNKVKVPNFDRFRIMLGLGMLAFILLIVFIILAVFVLPKATITVQTTSLPVSASLTLNASSAVKTLDETGGNIPAAQKSSTETSTQSVPVTGQQNNGQKASGTMVFYNCNQNDTLSGTNHTVSAGTGITLNGLTYITQENAVVPPSHFNGSGCEDDMASNNVDVVSQTGGSKFNQDISGGYSVSGYSTITGSGSKMSGGTDNIITVVSQADLDGAQSKLTSSDTSSFTKSFENQLASQGLYVLTSTLQAGTPVVTSTPAVGQQASTVSVTIKITYTVLTLQKSDLQKAITDALNKQVNSSEQKLSNGNVLNSATVSVQSQSSPTTATLAVTEDTTAVPILDVASIKKEAVGQKTGDIAAAIDNLPGVKNVTVKLSPFWVSKAPKASKITVVQQQVKSGS
jgi:hypothetical protein